MSSVTVKSKVPQFLKNIQLKELKFVTIGGQNIQNNMRTRAPKDSGNLINSVETEAGVEKGRAVSETGPTADYAVYVERGTGVYAVNGDGRKTPWTYQAPDGQWYTTRGAEAQPFAEPGYQAAAQGFDALARRLLAKP